MTKLKSKKNRVDRFAMQDTARIVLGINSRVASCQRTMARGKGGHMVSSRGISVSAEGRAHYHGVSACGDVWTCPVCSAKISEERRQEVLCAMKKHRDNGGVCVLTSYTFSHQRVDNLDENLKGFLGALSKMKADRRYKEAIKTFGVIGSIRALEVTHGNENGWHPHCHEIWFLEKKPTKELIDAMHDSLFQIWSKYCVNAGIGKPNKQHGVKIDFDDIEQDIKKIEDELLHCKNPWQKRLLEVELKKLQEDLKQGAIGAYLAKWGSELTGAMKKNKSKKSGRSPWAILSDITDERKQLAIKNNKNKLGLISSMGSTINLKSQDVFLFRQYAKFFAGKRQLFWSRGLKDRFGINDISDEIVADKQLPKFARDLSSVEWSAILWSHTRSQVLEVAESYPLFLDDYISKIVGLHDEYRKQIAAGKNVKHYSLGEVADPDAWCRHKEAPGIWLPGDYHR